MNAFYTYLRMIGVWERYQEIIKNWVSPAMQTKTLNTCNGFNPLTEKGKKKVIIMIVID